MTNTYSALRQAHRTWKQAEVMDMSSRRDAASELAKWGIFSTSQIAKFARIKWEYAREYNPKTDRTGGRIPPESLPYLIAIIDAKRDGQLSPEHIRDAIVAGCSFGMISKMTGIPTSTVARMWKRSAPIVTDKIVN